MGPAAYPPWPGLNYFLPTIMLTKWHVCSFCPYLIFYTGHCGVTNPCITLLWFYVETFLIATVSAIPIIIAVLYIWAIGLVLVLCWVSTPETGQYLCSGFCKLVLKVLLNILQCMPNVLHVSWLLCPSLSIALNMIAPGDLHPCLQLSCLVSRGPLLHLDHYCIFWRK